MLFVSLFQLVVHVGVSGIATELTLEQQAHNNGYDKPDVKLMVPSTAVSVMMIIFCKIVPTVSQ